MSRSMQSDRRRPAAYRRAIALLWTAMLMLVFVGIAGIVCDVGYVMVVGGQLQDAADAAALAGVFKINKVYSPGNVRTTAKALAAANYAAAVPVILADNDANDTDGDIVIGRYDTATKDVIPDLVNPDAVKVWARRASDSPGGALPLLFAPIFGVSTMDVERQAIAQLLPAANPGALATEPNDDGALDISGHARIVVNGGDVVVNSTSVDAVSAKGDASRNGIDAEHVRLMPDAYGASGGSVGGTDAAKMRMPVPDPLIDVEEPVYNVGSDEGTLTSGIYEKPGDIHYFSGGINVSSNNTLEIRTPGIYVLGNQLRVHADGALIAHGVMFYLVDDAQVQLGGGPGVDISGPTSGTYEGISIWQARDNESPATFGGNSEMKIDGIIYMPAARMELSGTCDNFSTQLIARSFRVKGDGTLTVNWDGEPFLWGCLVE